MGRQSPAQAPLGECKDVLEAALGPLPSWQLITRQTPSASPKHKVLCSGLPAARPRPPSAAAFKGTTPGVSCTQAS